MASRAILRRRKFIFDYLNVRTFYLTHNLGSRNYRFNMFHQSECFDAKKLDVNFGAKLDFSGLGYFSYGAQGISVFGPRNARFQLNIPLSVTLMSYSVRLASTATVKQSEPGINDERNGELSTKKRNEESAEECHQAVEGLSTAKAKAKTKRLQDSKKGAKSVCKEEDWDKKIARWKHEIRSTFQHYWLGFKLLWADMRISSSLLLKLAGGRSLSRMERQQLTRTSADIFRLIPFA
ncbi:hypothetical protein Golax_012886, partial [Gossypium laxum]|nr:hypothetical protein [Gossypium laxum]